MRENIVRPATARTSLTLTVFRCRVLGRTLPVPVPAQREHAVQREFLGRVRRGLSSGQEETQVRKPVAVRQRLRAGVRVRAVRHARGLLRRDVRRPVRQNETRERTGAFEVPQESQFHR